MADPDSLTAPHRKHEMHLLQEMSMQLNEEKVLLKDKTDGMNESEKNSAEMIADLERALAEERTNYRQLLQIMVETAEENAELSVQVN